MVETAERPIEKLKFILKPTGQENFFIDKWLNISILNISYHGLIFSFFSGHELFQKDLIR
jgi:hypothetical protein